MTPGARDTLYDAELSGHIDAAATRLEKTLLDLTPHLAPIALEWLRSLSPDREIANYFRHEFRFPMLLLPWWLSDGLGRRGDRRFQRDLVYSTVCGYGAVRLLDDTLDGTRVRPDLLPAGVILQGEFQGAFVEYFPGGHPFWDRFRRHWYGAADFAADHEGARDFEERVKRRLGPAMIPVAAVAYRANRVELLAPWTDLVGRLARVEQLLDDVTDWLVDWQRQAPNRVLEAYPGRAVGDEPVEAWMLREGLTRGLDLADSWLNELVPAAASLESAGLDAFVERRQAIVRQLRLETAPGLRELELLRSAFPRSP